MSSVERDNPPPRRKSCGACRAAKHQIPELLAVLNGQGTVEPDASICVDQFAFDAMPGLGPPPVVDLYRDLGPRSRPSPSLPLADQARTYTVPVPVYTGAGQMVHVRSEMTFTLSELMSSRFQYAIDILKDTPRTMVTENRTAWSHAQLYSSGMPRAMQDAYACCALYITKTPINGPMVTAHIHSRHQELALSPLPATPPELLAHTQALLLYQIMHLFDTDLHAVNSASSLDTLSMSALQAAASLLFSSTHFPPSPDQGLGSDGPDSNPSPSILPPTMTSPAPFWTLWIFEESARRTILFAFYFIQILRLVRGDKDMKCDGKLGLLHSWYASAYLWNASSAADFADAWTEKKHFVVRNVDFSKVLSEALPEDVAVLGRMLLVTALGVEKMREWFSGKGAVL
ncbi:hypothetical protein BDW67DRAFT_174627 [Aspergillus spinulosporus]